MQSNRYFSGLTLFNLLGDSRYTFSKGAIWLTFAAKKQARFNIGRFMIYSALNRINNFVGVYKKSYRRNCR
ncbi:hypothetical protein DFQ12_3912 [Sphingobacterium detergens]|uniref:Uncharacterized protein n=1 Tax=Sphingobacterium detergens TaxID=1145106 RepID=A0A420AQM5_SPHD1|nr:hypothetical protein DFQ12_3912 [Sphingobacterium detergens]